MTTLGASSLLIDNHIRRQKEADAKNQHVSAVRQRQVAMARSETVQRSIGQVSSTETPVNDAVNNAEEISLAIDALDDGEAAEA